MLHIFLYTSAKFFSSIFYVTVSSSNRSSTFDYKAWQLNRSAIGESIESSKYCRIYRYKTETAFWKTRNVYSTPTIDFNRKILNNKNVL